MKRLGNLRPQRAKAEISGKSLLTLTGGKSKAIKLTEAGALKLGIKAGDRVDILEGNAPEELFIAKAIDAIVDDANLALPIETRQNLPGKKVSATLGFTSTIIHPKLKALGTSFEISDQTTEFEGLKWNRLVPISSGEETVQKTVTEKASKKSVDKPVVEVKEETVDNTNF